MANPQGNVNSNYGYQWKRSAQIDYVCAKLKLAQSKKCYPQPPEKGMVGFSKPKLKVVN